MENSKMMVETFLLQAWRSPHQPDNAWIRQAMLDFEEILQDLLDAPDVHARKTLNDFEAKIYHQMAQMWGFHSRKDSVLGEPAVAVQSTSRSSR